MQSVCTFKSWGFSVPTMVLEGIGKYTEIMATRISKGNLGQYDDYDESSTVHVAADSLAQGFSTREPQI